MAEYYTLETMLEALGMKTKLQKFLFLRKLSKYDLIGEINLKTGISLERMGAILNELERRGELPKTIKKLDSIS